MQDSSDKQRPLLATLLALLVATPMVAAAQSAAPTASSASPVVATNEPAPAGTGPNPGDRVRAQMQSHVRPWPWNAWNS